MPLHMLKIHQQYVNHLFYLYSNFNFTVTDDRRRAGRGRDDNRRHTLGNDMMNYAQNQPQPQQQRAMDLEVEY